MFSFRNAGRNRSKNCCHAMFSSGFGNTLTERPSLVNATIVLHSLARNIFAPDGIISSIIFPWPCPSKRSMSKLFSLTNVRIHAGHSSVSSAGASFGASFSNLLSSRMSCRFISGVSIPMPSSESVSISASFDCPNLAYSRRSSLEYPSIEYFLLMSMNLDTLDSESPYVASAHFARDLYPSLSYPFDSSIFLSRYPMRTNPAAAPLSSSSSSFLTLSQSSSVIWI